MALNDTTATKCLDELLNLVVEGVSIGMILIDRAGRMVYVNAEAERLFGYARHELLGQPVELLVPERIRVHHPGYRETFFAAPVARPMGNRSDLFGLRKDGSKFPVEVGLTPVEIEAGLFVLGTIRDISLRRQAEDALRQSRAILEHMDLALRSAGVGTWDWLIGDNVIIWDDHMHALFGLKPGTFGGTFEAAMECVHPEDRERAHKEVTATVERDASYDTELRVVWPDHTVHVISSRGKVFRDEEGRPLRMTGICWDVTARTRAEEDLHRLTVALTRSNAELEQFAYIASHDLQEPLRKVQSFGDLLEAHAGPALDEKGRMYLQRMLHASQRMQRLINDLLTFARVTSQAEPFVAVDLTRVAQEVVSDLEGRLSATDGRVEIGELPHLEAAASQMRQLLQNLIGNALKFHREGVPPVVILRSRLIKQDDAWGEHAFDEEACEITVEDNGIGFEEKYLKRIFAPFQRLHGQGKYEGTGMGLAICRKIVERHGGTLTARSTPGQGSTFTVILPLRHPTGELHG